MLHVMAAEAEVELPVEPWVYGVGALVAFLALLAVLFAFRHASGTTSPPRRSDGQH